jgi:hypothetical protein
VPTIVNNIHAPPAPMPAAQVSHPETTAISKAKDVSNHSRHPNLAGRKRRMACGSCLDSAHTNAGYEDVRWEPWCDEKVKCTPSR